VVIAIAMGAGFTLGYVIHHNSEPITQVRGQDGQIRVPFEAWEIAWDGRPPEVKAPWGESYTPEGRCFFKSGSEACAYNPFEIAKDTSSPEFVVYQIDRAVERVHGTDPAAPKMSDAVLDSSFVKQFEGKKYTVAGSLYRDSGLRSRTQAVVLTGWEILFALLVGVWWRRFGPGADMNRTRWFAILFFTMPYVILFTLEILDARGVVSTRAALAFTMIGLRSIAQAIPLGTGMLWAIPAFVGLASLWYVRRCYVKAEAPLRCGEKSLLSEY
jgi:hypothetical protein